MRLPILLFAGTSLFIGPALAGKPVSYPGGWSSMITTNADAHALQLLYSPTAKYSVGYGLEYWRDNDYAIHALQINNLLKRWNMPDAQANLYLKSGVGIATSDEGDFDGETDPAAFTGVLADWENRRLFISYENRYTEAGNIDDFFMQSARVGVAPYIGDYGDLHTWLMLEASHTPEDDDTVSVTPLVRFFKGNHLVEAGASNRGDVMFHWMINY